MSSHPQADVPAEQLENARQVCLDLPDAVEQETWGHPTFRVRAKIFATVGVDSEAGHATMTMKAPAGEQEILLQRGHPFFYPKYVGPKGWIGIVIDDITDWEEVEELVEESYRLVAPKKLVARLDERRE